MVILRNVLTVLFIAICIALTVLILLQQGKDEGVGSIGGMGNTYWSRNKGRSADGTLVKVTRGLAVVFVALAVVLNLGF